MSDLEQADYSAATRTCDIVMKGGITSGVVYPHAICELAKTYRFCRVGGTSAGAIAAAAAAAAELGRDAGGFRELARLPAWIGGDRHLLELFQAQPATAGLFRVVLTVIERRKWPRVMLTALKEFPAFPVLGSLVGIAVAAGGVVAGGSAAFVAVIAGVILAAIGILAGAALGIARALVSALPRNMFGLCSGAAVPGSQRPALTPWLTELIERCAGRVPGGGAPLTFGDLEHAGLELAMMTTDLTTHTAKRLPWDSREFWFDPEELKQFFPEHVVDHMVNRPPALPDTPAQRRRWRSRPAPARRRPRRAARATRRLILRRRRPPAPREAPADAAIHGPGPHVPAYGLVAGAARAGADGVATAAFAQYLRGRWPHRSIRVSRSPPRT